jgi:hypothetical protein
MPANETAAQMAAELDKALLDVLVNGQTVVDNTTGQAVKISPSAAMLAVICKRVKDLDAGGLAVGPNAELMAKFKDLKLAPVDDRDDYATRTA